MQRLDEGHQLLQESLEGIDPEEAFLGSRWSVWEVLNHLDAENYVAALEEICAARGYVLNIYGEKSNIVFSGDETDTEAIYHLVEDYLSAREGDG